jgi:hypothetical protein
MATRSKATFQKRQKEMKRLEKQRLKADRRAQKSLAKRAEIQARSEGGYEAAENLAGNEIESAPAENEAADGIVIAPPESLPRN